MSDDEIEFKALTTGLGFKQPKPQQNIHEIKIPVFIESQRRGWHRAGVPHFAIRASGGGEVTGPAPTEKSKKNHKFLYGLLIDFIFATFMIMPFILLTLWQFKIIHVKDLIQMNLLFLYALLWMTLFFFYFMFFKQFKIPSFGKKLFHKEMDPRFHGNNGL